MAKRYGWGEYERNDVDVRTSTWDIRCEFLDTLVNHKTNAIFQVFWLADWDLLPRELLLPDKLDQTFYFIFIHRFRKNPLGIELDPRFLETPLNHYLSLLEGRAEDLALIESQSKGLAYPHSLADKQKQALNALVPNWTALRSMPEAGQLSSSLESWAVSNNLNEDWVLDFIVCALNSFYASTPSPNELGENEEVNFLHAAETRFSVEWKVREALNDALLELRHQKVTMRLWDTVTDDLETEGFRFRSEDFEWIPPKWLPVATTRAAFVSETKERFEKYRKALVQFDRFNTLDNGDFETTLNEYCDKVEAMAQAHPAFGYPFEHEYEGQLLFLRSKWVPEEKHRKTFIEESLDEIQARFKEYKHQAKSIKAIRKDALDLALYSYCNRVEKSIPANYSKTPTRVSPTKHFIWLADYQVPPVKTFRQIAERHDAPRPTESGIRKPITILSKTLGLQLRKAPKTGRPKGVKEKRTRLRVTRSYPSTSKK